MSERLKLICKPFSEGVRKQQAYEYVMISSTFYTLLLIDDPGPTKSRKGFHMSI